MINQVLLLGRVGNAEMKYAPSGVALLNFSLATHKYNPKTKDKTTTWHRVTVWGDTAERVQSRVVKGAEVFVEGEIENREYTDKQGQKRTASGVKARRVLTFAGSDYAQQAQDGQRNAVPHWEPPQGDLIPETQQKPNTAARAPQQKKMPESLKQYQDFMTEEDIPF